MLFEAIYDEFLKTEKRLYCLDDERLFFLTVHFSTELGIIVNYSFDIEKARDSHYIFNAVEADKIFSFFDIPHSESKLANKLRAILCEAQHGESALLDVLRKNDIAYKAFHYN